MKFMVYGEPTPEIPLHVRLTQCQQGGITMQVYHRNTWLPICTLKEDGTLGLWDVKNKVLKDLGFDMHEGHIHAHTM